MTDLTDADRAEIERIIGPRENKSLRDVLRDSLEHGVAYGIAAGRAQMREEAARVCDDLVRLVYSDVDRYAQTQDRYRLVTKGNAIDDCAAAIRALP